MTNCYFRVAENIYFLNFVHASGKYSAILAATRHGGETLCVTLIRTRMDGQELKPKIESEEIKSQKVWNSLEITKIFVALLTPIAIFIFTKQTNERLDLNNKIQDNNKRVFENRQKFYDQVGTTLNDFYCYHLYVGHWKEMTPKDIIKKKRRVDQLVYTYNPFFEADFKTKYDAYMKSVFRMYSGTGGDAKIRSECDLHKKFFSNDSISWNESWANNFTDEDNRIEVFNTYNELLKEIGNELNLKVIYTVETMPDQKPN